MNYDQTLTIEECLFFSLKVTEFSNEYKKEYHHNNALIQLVVFENIVLEQ